MTVSNTSDYNARDAILNLLSDAEVAKVSNSEAGSVIMEGEPYIDLDHLELGAQVANAKSTIETGQMLPKAAVSDATWEVILAYLKTHAPERA